MSVFMVFSNLRHSKKRDKTRMVRKCTADLSANARYGILMLWIFERRGEQMLCEIRREGVGAGYEMIVTSPDGS